jgi:hypothetical protein
VADSIPRLRGRGRGHPGDRGGAVRPVRGLHPPGPGAQRPGPAGLAAGAGGRGHGAGPVGPARLAPGGDAALGRRAVRGAALGGRRAHPGRAPGAVVPGAPAGRLRGAGG